jgi:hypothetical protein
LSRCSRTSRPGRCIMNIPACFRNTADAGSHSR